MSESADKMRRFELLVEVAPDGAGSTLVRCNSGTARLGDRLSAVDPSGGSTDLTVAIEFIELYDGVFIDELEQGHAGKIGTTEALPDRVGHGWKPRGPNQDDGRTRDLGKPANSQCT